MSSYAGRHSELYDIFYQDKPYRDEAAFVHWCIEQFGTGESRRLLELACGTGTHALEFSKLGYDVVALDYSADMVTCAKRKAAGVSSTVDFRVQDMRGLDLSDEPYDVVVCLFDSIGYVRTNEALSETLLGVHRNLRQGGLFIFEFWHAAAMIRNYDPVRVRRWQTHEGEILRISETKVHYAEQISEVTYSIFELKRDGTYSRFKEIQNNRFFLIQEMAGWLSNCGFAPMKWFGGFKDDESITDDTWHVVAVARKGSIS